MSSVSNVRRNGRREEERLPTRKLGTRLQHRVPLPLKIPIPAVDFRDLANAPRGTAPKKPVHAPTPHPAASGNSILAGSPVSHPSAGGEHMELSFEVAHVPSPVSLQPARFVGHQISAKFGRGWGKYNPVHVPICDVEDVEAELAKPNFGCKRLLCASKADIAKLNDRRRSAAQPLCGVRTSEYCCSISMCVCAHKHTPARAPGSHKRASPTKQSESYIL